MSLDEKCHLSDEDEHSDDDAVPCVLCEDVDLEDVPPEELVHQLLDIKDLVLRIESVLKSGTQTTLPSLSLPAQPISSSEVTIPTTPISPPAVTSLSGMINMDNSTKIVESSAAPSKSSPLRLILRPNRTTAFKQLSSQQLQSCPVLTPSRPQLNAMPQLNTQMSTLKVNETTQ